MTYNAWLIMAFASATLIASPDPGSLEEAEKNIVDRYSSIQSLAATMTTSEDSQEEQGKQVSVIITRQIEWTRKGQGFLYRAQTQAKTTQTDAQGRSTRESSSTTVSDGERVVRLIEQDGTVSAIQRKADVTVTPDLRALFEQLRKDNTLKRFPDVMVGNDDCYAIQLVPKEKKGSDILQTMIYFRKDIGLDVRTVVYGKGNREIFTSTTTNVRLNPNLSPDRFVLNLPDGVELIDQSKP
jgi:outer membrane lipoprotein-sorting protein